MSHCHAVGTNVNRVRCCHEGRAWSIRVVCVKWHPHGWQDPGFLQGDDQCSLQLFVVLMLWLMGVGSTPSSPPSSSFLLSLICALWLRLNFHSESWIRPFAFYLKVTSFTCLAKDHTSLRHTPTGSRASLNVSVQVQPQNCFSLFILVLPYIKLKSHEIVFRGGFFFTDLAMETFFGGGCFCI